MSGSTLPPKRFFSIHYYLLRFLGLGWWHHPEEDDFNNFPGLYLYYSIATEIFWVFGFVGLESIDPFIGDKDLDRFMFSLSFVITHDLTVVKIYIFFFKNREIQEIVRTLEIDLQQFYQNNDKLNKTVRLSKTLTALFIFFGWLTIGNTSMYGIVQDIHWKAKVAQLNDTSLIPFRALPQPIYIPWNFQNDFSYIATFLLETVGLLWTGHIVMTIDTFIGSIIVHMSSQFLMMQEAISTAYERTINQLAEGLVRDDSLAIEDFRNMNSMDPLERIVRSYCSEQEFEKALENTLRNCFRQHQLLISCVKKFASTYSYGFMTQLISSLAAICVIMVQLSMYLSLILLLNFGDQHFTEVGMFTHIFLIFFGRQDASSLKSIRIVTSLAFFAVMIIQLAIQCFTGNELTYQAQRVSDAVMSCKWDRIPARLRGSLVLMIQRSQRPLHLSAAGYANMNNDCFLAILKAAYSYYAVLSQKQANI